MKRFLLPLLAALALPTSVSAEVIYLRCSGSSKWYPYFEVTINEAANSATLNNTRGANPALLQASQSSFVISKPWSAYFEVVNINRYNGNFTIRVQDKKFPSIDIGPARGSGKCTKAPSVQRAF